MATGSDPTRVHCNKNASVATNIFLKKKERAGKRIAINIIEYLFYYPKYSILPYVIDFCKSKIG